MVVVVVVLVEFVVLVMFSGCSRNCHGSSSFTLFSSLFILIHFEILKA